MPAHPITPVPAPAVPGRTVRRHLQGAAGRAATADGGVELFGLVHPSRSGVAGC